MIRYRTAEIESGPDPLVISAPCGPISNRGARLARLRLLGRAGKYTFDNLTKVWGLKRYAIYAFDYGAPIGFRLALARPERTTTIISQNGIR
jgi:hypothetical protein